MQKKAQQFLMPFYTTNIKGKRNTQASMWWWLIRFTNKEVLVWARRQKETPTPNPEQPPHHYVVVTLIRSIDSWAKTQNNRKTHIWSMDGTLSSLRECFELEELQTTRRDMFPLQRILQGASWAAAAGR